MEFIIYKTKLQDFVKELQVVNKPYQIVYITKLIKELKRGVNSYVIVLSAFNAQQKVVHLNSVVCSVNQSDTNGNEKAKATAKKEAEKLERYLKDKGFGVNGGYLGVASMPLYGTLEGIGNEVET
jgi:hypothetical protein